MQFQSFDWRDSIELTSTVLSNLIQTEPTERIRLKRMPERTVSIVLKKHQRMFHNKIIYIYIQNSLRENGIATDKFNRSICDPFPLLV